MRRRLLFFAVASAALAAPLAVAAPAVSPATSLAGGDIDGLPGNEIVACGDTQPSTIAFKGDGTMLWTAAVSCYMPSIADLDGDGAPEWSSKVACSTARRAP